MEEGIMSNQRDSGRYDQFTDTTSDTNVRVDFAWGNIPMQPNDDRGEATLDPALDSHIIATSEYEGFPAFLQGAPYDDTITNVTVPNVVGMTASEAQTAIGEAGLDYGSSTTEVGANSENDGTVKSQSPAAGTLVNISSESADSVVNFVVYDNPQVAAPDLSGMNLVQVGNALTAAGLVGSSTLVTSGATLGNNGTVKSQTPAAGTMVDPGSTIEYELYNYISHDIAGIREYVGDVNRRYLYLQGRNSGIVQGNTIVLSDTGVANYNRPFDVIAVVNDDAFNTGGTKITIQNGLMDGTGGDVTNTGTWAFM